MELKVQKIKKITGNLIINSKNINNLRIGEVGLDHGPYNQGLSSFNLDFNRFKVTRNGHFPNKGIIQIIKNEENLTDEIFIFKDREIETWEQGELERNFYSVPIRNTLKTNSRILLSQLKKLGIKLLGKIKYSRVKQFKVIKSHSGKKISELIKSALEYSNNLFMEALLLKATRKKKLKRAVSKMKEELVKEFPFLSETIFINASGLNLKTKITLNDFTYFLSKTWDKKLHDRFFYSYLTLAGSEGFFYKRFLHNRTYQSFFGKTGSLHYITTICGVVIAKKTKSFCVHITDKEKRAFLTGKYTLKKEQLRRKSSLWKKEQDKIIEYWITKNI